MKYVSLQIKKHCVRSVLQIQYIQYGGFNTPININIHNVYIYDFECSIMYDKNMA